MGSKSNLSAEKKPDAKKFEGPPSPSPSSPTKKKDAADNQQIEKKLLQLMEDFETGKLKAFGKDSKLRQMEEIREQQEKLAKLHFDVGAEQDLYPPLSEDGLRISEENMTTLMRKLAQLSESIENLHSNSYVDRKTVTVDAKTSSVGSHQINFEGEVGTNNQSCTPNPQHDKSHSYNGHVPLHPPPHHHSHHHHHHHPKSSSATHTPKEHREQPQIHEQRTGHDTSPSFVYVSNSHKISSPLNTNTFNKHENTNVGLQMKIMNNSHQDFSNNIKVKHHN